MSNQQISRDTPSATSSQASEDGRSPSSWQGGLQMQLFSLDLVPASRSASQAEAEEQQTRGIFGLSSNVSLQSAALQLSLESRLRASMGVDGSPEYELTWSQWAMPWGLPICALRAWARHTSEADSGGWPTPDSSNVSDGTPYEVQERQLLDRRARVRQQQEEGTLTPGSGRSMALQMAAQAAGWGTPSTRDGKDAGQAYEANPLIVPVASRLPRQASGTTQSSSHVSTASRGVLNPELPRWLMGFPAGWGSYAPTATPSRRKSRQSS